MLDIDATSERNLETGPLECELVISAGEAGVTTLSYRFYLDAYNSVRGTQSSPNVGPEDVTPLGDSVPLRRFSVSGAGESFGLFLDFPVGPEYRFLDFLDGPDLRVTFNCEDADVLVVKVAQITQMCPSY